MDLSTLFQACRILFISLMCLALFHSSRGLLVANETIITETNGGYGSCPANCKITLCASQVGCSLCENGFCLHYQKNGTSSKGICLSSCPSGFYCQQVRFSICRACKDTNCDTCDSLGKCTKCASGFTRLSDGNCHADITTVPMATETTADMTTDVTTSDSAVSGAAPVVG
ncbi:R-spondin-1-like [Ylistrum balloti]|uniref:R-spondin-1-like n=1 Tax=Ylistrum balloti TaxID=509963 RepID=UPI002905DDB4|nr:R-spondin-1-like [Ylistrum balloti]